ncbi:ABC transporter ATP-binding protein [Thiosulfativibrio zosterae]|uniref:ABC transporter ATP-binding subunit n=1 Tax=Thiosulfativibrio zosterae TaxID=2675053 RepID=A0A6F8PMB8_9GAMM|nr:ABC transporter ATP-binding protein [Thiosulfativibrio zosterae]BBP43218.1 ABC transporter ATP-binding subunit [Thiosulfativibrio zosterae]
MSVPAVQFEGVSKNYHHLRALNNISFDVEEGSFFGLLGPNGAGKSTLINCMSGLVKPSDGQIFIKGAHVIKDYRQARRALGLVPQELISDPFFSIRELLRIQSGYFGLVGAKQLAWVDELLERLALSDKADQITNMLSGGMKRRLLIAMALVHKPQVLVLDEPTAGVDVDLRRTLWEFAQELHQQGHTIILTTHYLEEAEALCQKVAILQHGEVKAMDTTAALLSKHPYRFVRVSGTGNYKSLLPPLAERLVEFDVNGGLFKMEKDMPLPEMLGWLHQSGLNIQDISTRDASLEEVFLNLTGATK